MASHVCFDGIRLKEAHEFFQEKRGRSTIVLRLLDDPPWIDKEALEEYIADMKRGDGKCDFFIIQLIRLLYVLRTKSVTPEVEVWISRLTNALVVFPYWPHTNGSIPLHSPHSFIPPSDDMVFWSENHILMLLSSAYLLRHYLYETNQAHLLLTVTDREESLLLSYLSTHVQFGGIYEVLSHVYLPYTISSLLNLIDFAPEGCIIQQHAHTLLHRILYQVLLCTTASNGICCLTASNRAYERTRERTHGHNINQLIRLLVGKSPDPYDDTALIDFLLTTTWQPTIHELEELNHAYAFEGFVQMTMNHSVRDLGLSMDTKKQSSLYETIALSERTPFYWSAGLITHSSFIRDTLSYQQQKGLQKNVHLWPLRFLPSMWSEHLLSQFRHFAHGQCYTGMSLNVYKKHSLLLTSLEYHEQEGLCGYQQLPWIANCGGIGVWTQSGGHNDNHDKEMKDLEKADQDKGKDLSNDDVEVLIKNNAVSITNLIVTSTKSSTSSTSSSSQHRRTRNGICNLKRLRLHIPATHTHAPYVSQKGPLLAVAYITPPILRGILGDLIGTMTRLYWPSHFFDEEIRDHPNANGIVGRGVWWIGRRDEAIIGVCCTQPTVVVYDDSCQMQTGPDIPPQSILSRVCHSDNHAWIVFVGTLEEYPTLDLFVHHCMDLHICEATETDGYVLTVVDAQSSSSPSLCLRVSS